MDRDKTTVVAIDPGETSGFAVWVPTMARRRALVDWLSEYGLATKQVTHNTSRKKADGNGSIPNSKWSRLNGAPAHTAVGRFQSVLVRGPWTAREEAALEGKGARGLRLSNTEWPVCQVIVGQVGPFRGDLGSAEAARWFAQLLSECSSDKRVGQLVVEDFQLRVGGSTGVASTARSLLSPVRVTSGLRTLLGARGKGLAGSSGSEALYGAGWRFTMQQASDAKTVVTDDRLRRWGAWAPGLEHARDATRHLVFFGMKRFL